MQKTPSPRVSIRDVANAAGVSLSSVSRVINNSGYASPELKLQVLTAVETLGYEPDINAQHMRRGNTKTIGYLLQNIANPFLGLQLSAIESFLQMNGYSLLIGTSEKEETDRKLVSFFKNRRLDGIIASPGREYADPRSCPFTASGMPVVIVDRDMGGNFDCVKIDHAKGMVRAMDYLITLGHRRIALLISGSKLRPGREKLVGYKTALQSAGLSYDDSLIHMPDSWIESSSERMSAMLELDEPPTALIAVGTPLLSGAVRTVRQAGLEIPRDMSVIGIGGTDTLELMYPPVTALRYDLKHSGELVVNMMMDRLGAGAQDKQRSILLTPDLMIGESCAPPNSSHRRKRG